MIQLWKANSALIEFDTHLDFPLDDDSYRFCVAISHLKFEFSTRDKISRKTIKCDLKVSYLAAVNFNNFR